MSRWSLKADSVVNDKLMQVIRKSFEGMENKQTARNVGETFFFGTIFFFLTEIAQHIQSHILILIW